MIDKAFLARIRWELRETTRYIRNHSQPSTLTWQNNFPYKPNEVHHILISIFIKTGYKVFKAWSLPPTELTLEVLQYALHQIGPPNIRPILKKGLLSSLLDTRNIEVTNLALEACQSLVNRAKLGCMVKRVNHGIADQFKSILQIENATSTPRINPCCALLTCFLCPRI